MSTAESAARQWSVSDSDLVLPEYVIHFSYVSEVSLLSAPPMVASWLLLPFTICSSITTTDST